MPASPQRPDVRGGGPRIGLDIAETPAPTLDAHVEALLRAKDWRIESLVRGILGDAPTVRVEYRFGGANRSGAAFFVGRGDLVYAWQFSTGGGATECDSAEVFAAVIESFRLAGVVRERQPGRLRKTPALGPHGGDLGPSACAEVGLTIVVGGAAMMWGNDGWDMGWGAGWMMLCGGRAASTTSGSSLATQVSRRETPLETAQRRYALGRTVE
ncbi:MAG: hypothetical protein EXR66_08640 [Dehalococcoidia bacterium]|nr:hypothetical protein [Dehalococcoidia bacterium]